jgi:hypothetical protein
VLINKLLEKKISLKVKYILIIGLCLALAYNAYLFVVSDEVPSLDCMTINQGYLGYVQDQYSNRTDFDTVIWPRAIDIGGELNSICYKSIEKNGLIDGQSIKEFLTTSMLTSNYSPFPIQEPTAQYMIRKDGNSYVVNYKRGIDDIQAYVGSSPSDLDQFVDKQVKLSGHYIDAKPYCKGECTGNSSNKQTVLKIESISLAQ